METFKSIVVDGNDGTGKTTLVETLKSHGYTAQDRGAPTKMTDDPNVKPQGDEFYIILDAPVEVCMQRLLQAGKDLNERYHTIEDLTFYRQRFLEVVRSLPHSILVDAAKTEDEVANFCLKELSELNNNGDRFTNQV